MKLKEAQKFVKDFAVKQEWDDSPCIDKFDHLHEELIEMSKLLRYKEKDERISVISEKQDDFKDGIGDLLFATCRLANQLNIDLEEAFDHVKDRISKKFEGLSENKSELKQNL
jgi:NTP pyrophosphatase (non-canonical NTP hydrolase)